MIRIGDDALDAELCELFRRDAFDRRFGANRDERGSLDLAMRRLQYPRTGQTPTVLFNLKMDRPHDERSIPEIYKKETVTAVMS